MVKRIAAIVVAAGSSSRLPGDVPKVYRELNGKMVLEHSLEMFQNHPLIDQVILMANPEHSVHYQNLNEKGLWICMGGKTRQESVYNGLNALADNPPDWVLVHDAARPHVTLELIDRVLDGLENASGTIPAIAVTDTIKRAEAGAVTETLKRDELHAVQTPQGFHYTELLAAHMAAQGQEYTDDGAVMEAAGMTVVLVRGDEANRKLTTPEDWSRMNAAAYETRIGQGFDVHQLIEDAGRPLMICGIEVTSDLALKGHSDADVGLHALVDALLGTIGAGDIGEHFPPSDAKWKDCDSSDFVKEAMRLVKEKRGRVINADVTIIAEVPKLVPYKAAMRERMAQLLEIDVSRVSVKATTTETLGFIGRKEGIAAQAVVSVQCS